MKSSSKDFCFGFYGHKNTSYEDMNAEEIIKKLDLKPLPEEGGFFKRILESPKFLDLSPENQKRYGGPRREYSLINYLMTPTQFSALHTVKSDETWTYIAGSPIDLCVINPETGELSHIFLNKNNPQYIVPRDFIFGAKPVGKQPNSFSLATCEVRPGFEYEDFKLVRLQEILNQSPDLKGHVEDFIRDQFLKIR